MMQVNVAGLRRNIKNIAFNYTEAQVKVREATSNDPWGPSTAVLAEIADLTYNVVEFTKIMEMIWRRLNDQGKNWRHVNKALILMEYLIKTGVDKVAKQCKENIFVFEALRDFVYYEEGKDYGRYVREKANQLVNLIRDNERLRNERIKALKAKERFSRNTNGIGYNDEIPIVRPSSELEMVRPRSMDEEELHLKLALDISREEAEQERIKQQNDDVRLKIAIKQSEREFNEEQKPLKGETPTGSHLLDLLDISLGAASTSNSQFGFQATENTNVVGISEPFVKFNQQNKDPWQPVASTSISPSNYGNTSSSIHTPTAPTSYGWLFNNEEDTLAKSNDVNNFDPLCVGINEISNAQNASNSASFTESFNDLLTSNIENFSRSPMFACIQTNNNENNNKNQLNQTETKASKSTNPFL